MGSVIGSVAGAAVSGIMSGKASKAQSAGADKASEVQKYMYDTTREDLAPYRQTGTLANNRLAQLMGLQDFNRDDIAKQLGIGSTTTSGSTTSSPSGATVLAGGQFIPDSNRGGKIGFTDLVLSDGRVIPGSVIGEQVSGLRNVNEIQKYFGNPNQTTWKQGFQKGSAAPGTLMSTIGGGSTTGYSAEDQARIDAEIERLKSSGEFGSLAKRFGLSDYQEDPGYKFRLDQGNKAINQAQAARGNIFSGRALKEATDYNSGMASQEYGAAYGRYNNDQSNLYNRLAGLADAGRGATNTAVQANQQNANALGSIYAANGQNQANAAIQQGNVWSQGLAGMFGGGQSSYGSASKLPWQTFGNVNPAGGFYGF